ncbi:MAG TPA: bifunctional lytic transglycosylase/C40 family peptidase [Solirubrobacteraceae bacterium]|nr:bifunctional lytic transglycosylase/C40 family peptidase [Solirubrobacteraceae bacterium]
MKRALLSSCALAALLPVLFIAAALGVLGVLGGGAGVSLGQPAADVDVEQVAGIPGEYLRLFEAAGARYGIPWEVLAGIGKVECDDGQDPDPACTREGAVNNAGAGGPMQFLASTWASYGVSPNGGRPDRWNPADAIYSAANYLRANGAPSEIRRAIFAYNHSNAYVEEVLSWAATYEHEAESATPQTGGAAGVAVAFALAQRGVPYVWGGESPSGYDCSGLVQASYRAAGISLPRTAQEQFDAGPHLPATAPLQPGDLVFFGSSTSNVTHVGIVVAAGEMVDAPHTGTVVQTESFPTTIGARWGEDVYLGATRPAAK